MATLTAMRIEVDRDKLRNAFQHTGKLARRNVTWPLASTRLRIANGMLIAEAANTEETIAIEVCECGGDFEALLPSERMTQALGVSGETVAIEVDGAKCTVKSQRFKTSFQLPDLKDFPSGRGVPDAESITINAGWLGTQLKHAIRFADQEGSKSFALNGINVVIGDGEAKVQATDSRAVYSSATQCNGDEWSGLIPPSAANVIGGFAAGSGELTGGSNSVTIRCSGVTYTTALIEGRFPRVDEVLKPSMPESLRVAAGVLLAAIKRASIVTTIESKALEFVAADGSLKISACVADSGDALAEIPIPQEVEFSFVVNAGYADKAAAVPDADAEIGLFVPRDSAPVQLALPHAWVAIAQIGE